MEVYDGRTFVLKSCFHVKQSEYDQKKCTIKYYKPEYASKTKEVKASLYACNDTKWDKRGLDFPCTNKGIRLGKFTITDFIN